MKFPPSSCSMVLACSTVLTAGVAIAQTPAAVEEVIVIGVRDTHTLRTDNTMVAPADTAELLRKMPGANINSNGELTGIAQYRGMHGDRVNIAINGARVSSGGPNAMDAPLHYAPVAALESLTIRRGITPVSVGQETIGGHVDAVTYSGDFGTSNDFDWAGRTYLGGQSANNGIVGSAFLTYANRRHIFRTMAMTEQADDSRFPEGSIRPSEYTRDRLDLGYSFRHRDHVLSIDLAHNDTGHAGTPALPMDIESVKSDLLRSRYVWDHSSFTLTAEVYSNSIDHYMSNFHLRSGPRDSSNAPAPNRYRRTFTASDNHGFVIKSENFVSNGSWIVGMDGHYSIHEALIGNPNNPLFFIDNFRDAERGITGFFVERNRSLTADTGVEFGMRFNHVSMDSAPVSANFANSAMMNSLAASIAAEFNGQNLSTIDHNVDWFIRLSHDLDSNLIVYAGAARKTRSPSYQERYLWLPAESTGGLADGKNYVGNSSLKAEVAHEVELGLDFSKGRLNLYPRAFIKHVDDFIQGTPSINPRVNAFAAMMAAMTGMDSGPPLQFNNVKARYTGFDLEASYRLSSQWDLRVVASTVRGERRDIDDHLYRIAPDNLILALDYIAPTWSGSLEAVTYAAQKRVSATSVEEQTSGHSIVNVSADIPLRRGVELGVGIDNVFDREYRDHLGGYNRASNRDIATGERLPGLGRSVYGRLIWNF